jgi:hypothetical protein
MKKSTLLIAGIVVMMFASLVQFAHATHPNSRAAMYNWHGNYAYTPYGRPTALVVPPTAQLQTNWSWGAASSSVSRIDHQFTRDYLGQGAGGFYSTPHWPNRTQQFGVSYVRGPWYPTQSQNQMAHKGRCDRLCSCARNLAGKVCNCCKRSDKCDQSCGCCDEIGCCD